MGRSAIYTVFAAALASVHGNTFDPLRHLGGNGQYFEGPNIFGIDPEPPSGCLIDQAALVSRHGSRYPDQGAYNQWTTLFEKIQAADFTTHSSSLDFLGSWKPVLRHPDQEISQLSLTGYKELYDMGVAYRFRYPSLYTDNTPFTLWANNYVASHRVLDSSRLFARGYLGPNSSLADIYVVNSSDPRAVANSLAPSDLCPTFDDNGGGTEKTTWDDLWLPPATARINGLLSGTLNFTTSDVDIFGYLCGFETQIAGTPSPWCNTLTERETLQYEYSQDLRYYYGEGPGANVSSVMMLPLLKDLVQRFVDGPNKTYTNSDNTTFVPPPLIVAFTNDGQISQLAAAVGTFDSQTPLSSTHLDANRIYKASNFVTMRGTVSFERLNCDNSTYIRVKHNDVVYPVTGCQSGPGRSCPLTLYRDLVQKKIDHAGDFETTCNITSNVVPKGEEGTTFFEDVALPFEWVEKP
ncbi:putative histidine acid phosphatase [Saccharata proteae CBS 121410]|uniref:3-phytase n=1 Tax=Saccharata proteae CBS 121410 TaxID=1314787 RepID=A0A9P4LW14_9PEZI|nr:putative histidine acid phosphatase [Saccharata proteae CBS 121410]